MRERRVVLEDEPMPRSCGRAPVSRRRQSDRAGVRPLEPATDRSSVDFPDRCPSSAVSDPRETSSVTIVKRVNPRIAWTLRCFNSHDFDGPITVIEAARDRHQRQHVAPCWRVQPWARAPASAWSTSSVSVLRRARDVRGDDADRPNSPSARQSSGHAVGDGPADRRQGDRPERLQDEAPSVARLPPARPPVDQDRATSADERQGHEQRRQHHPGRVVDERQSVADEPPANQTTLA